MSDHGEHGISARVSADLDHPRASVSPLRPAQASSYIADWLGTDATWVPAPGEKHAEIQHQLIIDGGLRGNLVADAHLAADPGPQPVTRPQRRPVRLSCFYIHEARSFVELLH